MKTGCYDNSKCQCNENIGAMVRRIGVVPQVPGANFGTGARGAWDDAFGAEGGRKITTRIIDEGLNALFGLIHRNLNPQDTQTTTPGQNQAIVELDIKKYLLYGGLALAALLGFFYVTKKK